MTLQIVHRAVSDINSRPLTETFPGARHAVCVAELSATGSGEMADSVRLTDIRHTPSLGRDHRYYIAITA
jgi:hypothetical protein